MTVPTSASLPSTAASAEVTPPVLPPEVAALETWLATERNRRERAEDFDMNDAPDAAALLSIPVLHEAVIWLNEHVATRWRSADAAALRSQTVHRRLARVSIVTGTGAILLAVAQLALKQTGSLMLSYAAALEGLAVGAALVAVVVGLIAKNDRRWFGQRHLAERLRMLKFLALGHRDLWRGDLVAWRATMAHELAALGTAGDFAKVKQWSTGGEIEPPAARALESPPDPVLTAAIAVYYRAKRIDFQATYFRRRRDAYQHKTERWRHLSVPLFFLSVVCVIAHFALEQWVHHDTSPSLAPTAASAASSSHHLIENLAMWCVAAAAMIPVLGLGVRSWFAAFELPRSTNLFAAKYQALVRASEALRNEADHPAAVRRHIAADEHFLENEHREWLRLLLDTEWFL